MKVSTDNYVKKWIVSKLFNQKNYHKMKLYKIIFDYLIGRDYEYCKALFSNIIKQDFVAFDIGANQGQYACRLSKIMSLGKIYSFEPFKQNYISLTSMKKLLNLKNVIPIHSAVSNTKGRMKLLIPKINDDLVVGTQSVLEKYQRQEYEDAKFFEEVVDTTSIDDFVADNNIDRVDFIKIDTEGAELAVIRGGLKTIKKYLPILSIEIQPSNKELLFFNDIGYETYVVVNGKMVLYNSSIYGKRSGNTILINSKTN